MKGAGFEVVKFSGFGVPTVPVEVIRTLRGEEALIPIIRT